MSANTGTGASPWASLGPGQGDTAYRTQSLKYLPMDLALDESVSALTVFKIWLTAFAAASFVGTILWFFWLMVALATDTSAGWQVVSLTSGLVFWVLLLLPMMDEPVAEWRILLEDRASAADSCYAAIYAALARRQIPVAVQPQRIRSDLLAPEVVNSRLAIQSGHYTAYVSVFAYGTSLYSGWTMWRRRRFAVVIGVFFKDLIGSIIGRSGVVNQMLRSETIRAMREALHSATREGVEAASAGRVVPIAATFGAEIPIVDLRAPLVSAGITTYPGQQPTPTAPTPAPFTPAPFTPPAPTPAPFVPPAATPAPFVPPSMTEPPTQVAPPAPSPAPFTPPITPPTMDEPPTQAAPPDAHRD